MNEKEIESLANGVSEPISEMVLGFAVIINALKNQPGFDSSVFEKEIQEKLGSIQGEKTLLKSVLSSVLSD